MRLHLDYETASDINLKTAGAYKYAAHPSTRILMLGWAVNDEPENLWEPHKDPVPPRLLDLLKDPTVKKHAFNAPFERLITRHCLNLEIPYHEWVCTQVASHYLSFAGGLDKTLQAIGLQEKDKRGHQLIVLFCSPAPKNHKADWYDWNNRPKEWGEFCQYCRKDVIVERELHHWMSKFPGILDWDWQQWYLDQKINDFGAPLDVGMARSAIGVWEIEKQNLKEEMGLITKLPKVTRGPFLEYMNNRFGVELENTKKDYLAAQISSGSLPKEAEYLVKLWAQKEAKATSKYNAVVNVAGEGDRARGMFQYKGAARTDRVGGRLLQLQNLKRSLPFIDIDRIQTIVDAINCGSPDFLKLLYGPMPVSDILGGSIRHVISAPPGKCFAIADLSSIETVVSGWLARCDTVDRLFRSGRDSYKVFAGKFYNISYSEVTKEQRNFSKPPVLGCIYMLGWKGLIAYAEGMGVVMDEESARKAVDTFRGMYPEIPAFWKWIYDAVKYVTTTGDSCEGYRLIIERDKDFLRIKLPSGRYLSYFKPEMRMMPAPWDKTKSILNFTYMGLHQKTTQWVRISAHAGGLAENIVQSMAADILWSGLTAADNAGLPIVLHVHDEIGAQVAEDRAGEALKVLKECMTRELWWAPDMWLGADGFITKRFTKD